MASSISDLEEQLLSVTKQRVAIETEWIRVSEKLLAAKENQISEGKDVVVPRVSGNTETDHSDLKGLASRTDPPTPAFHETNSSATPVQTTISGPQIDSNQQTVHQPISVPPQLVNNHIQSHGSTTIPQPHMHTTVRDLPPPPTSFSESSSNIPPAHQNLLNQKTGEASDGRSALQRPENTPRIPSNINLGTRQLLRSQDPSHRHPSRDVAPTKPDSSQNVLQSVPNQSNHVPPQFLPPGNPWSHLVSTQTTMHGNRRIPQQWSESQPYQQPYMQNTRQIPAQGMSNPATIQQARWQQNQGTVVAPQGYFPQPQPKNLHTVQQHPPPPQGRAVDSTQVGNAKDLHATELAERPHGQKRSASRNTNEPLSRKRRLNEEYGNVVVATPPLNSRNADFRRSSYPPRQGPKEPSRFSGEQDSDPRQAVPSKIDRYNAAPAHVRSENKAQCKRSHHDNKNPDTRERHVSKADKTLPRRQKDRESDDNDESDSGSKSSMSKGSSIKRSRMQSGTPAIVAQYKNRTESPLMPRMAARKPVGSYHVPVYGPLAYAERQELELRYCARVAMIIGSKRCVTSPLTPYGSTKNIFQTMKDKFLKDDKKNPNRPKNLYRCAQDFVTDARGLLKRYVALGHCADCPFRPTGNERVMCWRMRLESVLDEKMRGIKKCLKECEEMYEVDDSDGKMLHVDAWFADDDLNDEVPLN